MWRFALLATSETAACSVYLTQQRIHAQWECVLRCLNCDHSVLMHWLFAVPEFPHTLCESVFWFPELFEIDRTMSRLLERVPSFWNICHNEASHSKGPNCCGETEASRSKRQMARN